MTKSRSIQRVANREVRADEKTRTKLAKDAAKPAKGKGSITMDSFVNFAQKMGVGAENALSTSGYGFNPITRIRTTLEWIHRGSWLGGVAVDVVADDMTRGGIDLLGDIDPDDMEQMQEAAVTLGVHNSTNDTIKWARLYGGAIAVMMIDGQDMATPLRLDTIGKGQFKGLLVLDRWMVEPSLSNLVTEAGPDIGLPKFYTITADAPALPRAKIHYTRCVRMEGIRLPYWQRVTENLWGESVLERLYDRMIAFDSATTGAAQLVYKAYLRTYKIKGMREIVAAGGPALNGLTAYVDMMRRFQNMEGITLLDGDDEFEAQSHTAFSGLSDALTQFGQQLSGALQIPLVRLFGQSPAGFSTGDTDLRMYYDTINQQQNKTLLVPMTKVYRAIAQSERITLPDGFKIAFRSLWQLTEVEKSEIAERLTNAVTTAVDSGLISDKVGMQELRQSSHHTDVFSNISKQDIEAASDEPAPKADTVMPGGEGGEGDVDTDPNAGKKPAAKDSVASVTGMKMYHDLDVAIEHAKGAIRQGGEGQHAWRAVMPADYGYIRQTVGADNDAVDCFVGPHPSSPHVWVIDQKSLASGAFDEHKVMLGYRNVVEAIGDYVASYTNVNAADQITNVRMINMQELKDWLQYSDLTKPCKEAAL